MLRKVFCSKYRIIEIEYYIICLSEIYCLLKIFGNHRVALRWTFCIWTCQLNLVGSIAAREPTQDEGTIFRIFVFRSTSSTIFKLSYNKLLSFETRFLYILPLSCIWAFVHTGCNLGGFIIEKKKLSHRERERESYIVLRSFYY